MRSDVFADEMFEVGNQCSARLRSMARLKDARERALGSCAGHASPLATLGCATRSQRRSVVEPDGIEPTTSCLQSTRSPS
jgi:hypothetical protein